MSASDEEWPRVELDRRVEVAEREELVLVVRVLELNGLDDDVGEDVDVDEEVSSSKDVEDFERIELEIEELAELRVLDRPTPPTPPSARVDE